MPDGNERHRRRAERLPVQFKLLYDDGEYSDIVTVENMSAGGMFIRTPAPLARGTEVYLIPICDAEDLLSEVKARVVWVTGEGADPQGMGVEFIEPTTDLAESLPVLAGTAGMRAVP